MLRCVAIVALASAAFAAVPARGQDRPAASPTVRSQKKMPEVKLLVWNVAKQVAAREELREHFHEVDIVCLQEFVPEIAPVVADSATPPVHQEFAASFTSWFSGVPTGVCTLSRHRPITTDALRSPFREGYLLTPKMALVSTHVIGGQPWMVVNLHGLNFQPVFTFMLQRQLQPIAERVKRHRGPVVVCGDFNTWSHRRLQVVGDLLEGCQAVSFPEHPQRKTGDWIVTVVGGNPQLPLDHVYTRGVEVLSPEVLPTDHSDHAPLRVTLRSTVLEP